MTDQLGCSYGPNYIECRKTAGSGCPGVEGGPHYFLWWPDAEERTCLDCGIGESEALGATNDHSRPGRGDDGDES